MMDPQVITRAAALVGFSRARGCYRIEGEPWRMAEDHPALAHTLIMRLIERLNEAGLRVVQLDSPESRHTAVRRRGKRNRWLLVATSIGSTADRLTTLCDAVEAIND